MHSPNSAGRFAASVEASRDAVERLVALLREETGLLASRRAEELRPLLEQKLGLLEEVEGHERERAALLRAEGFAEGTAGVRDFLAACGADAGGFETWRRMTDTLRTCRALNETNGLVIRRQLDGIQRAMQILRGQAPEDSAVLYGPRGTAFDGTRGREITRA